MAKDHRLRISFYTTYSHSVILMILISLYFVYTPSILENLQISETQFAFALTLFGIFNVITNQIASRYLIPKIGTTNCLILARLSIAFLPFLVFYYSDYYMFLAIHSFWGIIVGIQAPSLFTQVAIVEERTKLILNPIFKSSFSVGSLIGAGLASLFLGVKLTPVDIFFYLGIVYALSSITLYFFGLPRKYDVIEKTPKFSMPTKIVIFYGIINMMFFASIGIIIQWSSLWLTRDILAPIFIAGFIIVFFNIGEIFSNIYASQLIKRFNEKIVGPYFSIIGSIILFLSIISMNLYIILPSLIIFGFLTSNLLPISIRQAIKHSKESLPKTISHVSSIGFSGLIFGPAIVGYSAEKFGLTFNMYLLCIIFFIISCFMIFLMNKKSLVEVEGIEPTPPK